MVNYQRQVEELAPGMVAAEERVYLADVTLSPGSGAKEGMDDPKGR